jgi:uncharacterized protein YgiM (DUF1202 family)
LRTALLIWSFVAILAGAATALVKADRAMDHSPPPGQDGAVRKDTTEVIDGIDSPSLSPRESSYEVSRDHVRLRSAPGGASSILRTFRQGTSVRIEEPAAQNEWCRVQVAGGHEGWMKCDFLKQRPETAADSARGQDARS